MNRFAVLLTLCLVSAALVAQTTNGRIVGTVTDPTQAVVPGAKVAARQLETGAVRSTTTGAYGTYVVPNLPVGSYEVTVEVQGFKRYVLSPVVLEVDQAARVDVTLQPGQVSDSITVEGGAPLIETDQSSVGQVVDNDTISQLPLNGRNFIRLGSLIAGTNTGAPGADVVRGRQEGVALTANGQRAEYNNYMLDGADNNETFFGVAVVVPSIDAIQEFKVQTSNYSAEFGRASGAVVNVGIKAGTNQLHGTAYEFLRNDAFDARSFFSVGLTPLRQNQYGFSLGGPLVRNKVFLFGNYEGQRERRTGTSGYQVPTDAARRGDFTGLAAIYDPLALDASGNRLPFAGNQIPSARIHPVSQKLAAMWPAINNPSDPGRNYLINFNNPKDRDQAHVRGDYHLSPSDQVMARVSWTDRGDQSNSILYNGESLNHVHRGGVASWTHLFSPTVLNEARFSATLYRYEQLPDGMGTDFASQLGLPNFADYKDMQRFPSISVRNQAGFGGSASIPLIRREYHYQWIDQFTLIRGKHAVKLGLDIRRYGSNNYQPQTSAGSYTFNGSFTGRRGTVLDTGLPDLLLGLPQSQSILIPKFFDSNRLRNTRVNLYVQDDVNLTSRLTLNAGLRWERDGNWTEKKNRWAYFDLDKGAIVYPSQLEIPFKLPYTHRFEDTTSMKQPTNHAFGPRLGLAWRPFGDNRTVVRSAYGIFWGQPVVVILLNAALTPPPFLLRETYTSGTTTPELRFGVFPGFTPESFIPTNPTLYCVNPATYSNGYVQQWNFGIQRELPAATAVSVSYVGNKGTHLERRYQGNPALPPGPGSIAARRRYPEFGGITYQDSNSFSSYHSLQVQSEKKLTKGLAFLAGYTWSKSIDDTSSWMGVGPGDNLPQDPSRIFLEKGLSSFDLRQRFTLSFLYEVPLKTGNRVLDLAVAGWQSSGIVTLQTGFPTTATVGGDIPNAGTGVTRPNLNGKANLDPSRRTIEGWFDTSVFTSPAAYTFGTAGRNIIDGPGARGFDFSLMKLFRVTEGHHLQFRGEFFNFFNHPVFALPNTTFGNVNFGKIRGGGGGREIQFGLKYVF